MPPRRLIPVGLEEARRRARRAASRLAIDSEQKQLKLALEVESPSHLSFIESSRSAPGRKKLLDIAEALDIPLRERNTLLLAAGYPPLYRECGCNEPQIYVGLQEVSQN